MRDIRSLLFVRMVGYVDEDTLEVLRGELALESSGRLDDDYDQLFGERLLRPEGQGESCLELYRENDTEWEVRVVAEPPFPTRAELLELERRVFAAAEKCGLSAEEVFLRVND